MLSALPLLHASVPCAMPRLWVSKPEPACTRLHGTSAAKLEPVSALAFNGSASLLAAYSGGSGSLRVWSLAQSWTQSVAQRLRGLEPTLPDAVLKVVACHPHYLTFVAILMQFFTLPFVGAVMISVRFLSGTCAGT